MPQAKMKTLSQIDLACETARGIAHRMDLNDLAARHIECGCAHLREAWIAQSGQCARDMETLQADLRAGFNMLDAAFAQRVERTAESEVAS